MPSGIRFNRAILLTRSSGKVKCTGKRFSWYPSDHLRLKIEKPSCQQYKPGDIMAVRPLNWDKIIHKENDDEHWADPRMRSEGRSLSDDGNGDDDGTGEEDMPGGETGSGNGEGTKDGKGKGKGKGKAMEEGKGKGKRNGKGKGIVKDTPGGDDISCAVALQLHNENV